MHNELRYVRQRRCAPHDHTFIRLAWYGDTLPRIPTPSTRSAICFDG
jgi:hypothetical protein